MSPAERLMASARVAALTDQHDRHAERMRAMGERRTSEAEVMAQMATALREAESRLVCLGASLTPKQVNTIPVRVLNEWEAVEMAARAALAAYDAWLMERGT